MSLFSINFVQIRRLSLIVKVPNYGKQKKYRGQSVTYGELKKREAALNKPKRFTKNTAESLYPPIEHLDKRQKKQQIVHEEIKNLETVEEKIFKINMPRYYGWKSLILHEHNIQYNSLPYVQQITRTHIVKESGLPAYYDNVISNDQLDNIVQEIKGSVEDNIAFEYCRRKRDETKMEMLNENNEHFKTKKFIQKINRTILIHLSSKYPHLLNAEVDYEPRLEASWFLGGLEPSARHRMVRKKNKCLRKFADEPVTIPVQYDGHPVMHLRHKHPLREIVPLSECTNPAYDVPTYEFSPETLGYKFGLQHLTNIPGFWPGDESEFGLLSYHTCKNLEDRTKKYNDITDYYATLSAQAILASYSWLLSQACYQGFSTYNDITYPLTTQTVITNGKSWSFCVYQLNTILLHSQHVKENPKRNMCWITEPLKLFDKIENEKIHGLNEQVLKTLVKFYVNAPEERQDVNLKPYLGESVKVIADIEHDERRNWLEKQYKHLMCNRSRHRRIPEIYQWQKIYMIQHKTRPMEKRREPWQFGINVMHRRLDDHTPRYVPKCLRENPKKKRIGRWEKTYYP
ncbi:hypothetical protein DMN91_000886 [Ooceraea biroi]|uniref:28S ribosomal protein S30, mitochondrial n=1 Tax=Ooceraea biroi TaxID=2015173 RepID=A0A026WNJ2_OOCBI|nr:28S ribosomal protein S30, mitochondrial [Ooceraea biroi]EZA56664.1 28S ribosomal protein S30, mitochondrial [Ooceraea biroi]RLU27087.1 hypothetical protein DMN91_000886 [Ooceraea biroi]